MMRAIRRWREPWDGFAREHPSGWSHTYEESILVRCPHGSGKKGYLKNFAIAGARFTVTAPINRATRAWSDSCAGLRTMTMG